MLKNAERKSMLDIFNSLPFSDDKRFYFNINFISSFPFFIVADEGRKNSFSCLKKGMFYFLKEFFNKKLFSSNLKIKKFN